MLYKIDLAQYGITEGVLANPTSTADNVWNIAKANVDGINAAMQYAYDNNFEGVRLPKGNYTVCLLQDPLWYLNPQAITPKTGQIVDLGDSTLDLMYSSQYKSPFDPRPDNPPYYMGGYMFHLRNVKNVIIRNGELKGEMYKRTFAHDVEGFLEETWMENTVGIKHGRSSYDCITENINAHGFTGDSTSFATHGSSADGILSYYVNDVLTIKPLPPASTQGFIDSAGVIQPNPVNDTIGSFVSTKLYIDASKIKERTPWSPRTFQIQGSGGYNRTPNLPNHYIRVVFYNSSDVVVKSSTIRAFQRVEFPFAATYMRVQFDDIPIKDAQGNDILKFPNSDEETAVTWTVTPSASSGHVVRKSKFHSNHRGGLANPCDNILIEDCEIHSNGLDSGIGAPQFPDSTRYQVNFEDTFANNATVRRCEIYNGFHGMLANVENVVFTENIVSGLSSGIIIYDSCKSCAVTKNKFYDVRPFQFATTSKNNHLFANNFVLNKNAIFIATPIEGKLKINDNFIQGNYWEVTGDTTELNGNTFKAGTGSELFTQVRVGRGNNNVFDGKGKAGGYIIIEEGDNNIIENFSVLNMTVTSTGSSLRIKNTTFKNCTILRRITNYDPTKDYKDIYENCKFINTTIGFISGTNMGSDFALSELEFLNCSFEGAAPLLGVSDNVAFSTSARVYKVSFNGETIVPANPTMLIKEFTGVTIKLEMNYNSQGVLNQNIKDAITNLS